jgi:hypothetical protein
MPTEDPLSERLRFKGAADELYLASMPPQAIEALLDDGRLTEEPDPIAAAGALARLSDDNAPGKLHAVASTLNRRPRLAASNAVATELATAILTKDRRTGDDVGQVAGTLQSFADEARGARIELTPERWRRFVDVVVNPDPDRVGVFEGQASAEGQEEASPAPGAATRRAPLNLRATRTWLPFKPGCNDGLVTATAEGPATTIKSRFWIDAPFEEASEFVLPENWVTCGWPYWRKMEPVEEVMSPTTKDGVTKRAAVYEEIVDLPALGLVQVYLLLHVTTKDGSIVVDYALAKPSAARPSEPGVVTFDTGWLLAAKESIPDEQGGPGTYVEGVKSIRFRDDFWNQFPDLACDGGWVYLMIGMSLGGSGLPAVDPLSIPVTNAPDSSRAARRPRDGIGAVVDEWVADASRSLTSHGESLKSAYRRALARPHDPRWVNDLLGIGTGATSMMKSTMTAWRQGLAELAKMAGER